MEGLPQDLNLSPVWPLEPEDHPQEGGLAGAVGTDDGEELPPLDLQGDSVQDRLGAVLNANPVETEGHVHFKASLRRRKFFSKNWA